MQLNDEDIIKFYELQGHYDIISRNVGIIGDKEKFKKYIDRFIKDYKQVGAKIIRNEEEGICRIILDDIEYSFIRIKTLQDLKGRKFRKFI